VKKLFALLFFGLIGAAAWVAVMIYLPLQPAGQKTVFLHPGWSVHRIAAELKSAGVIRNATAFVVWHRLHNRERLRAGEYLFSTSTDARGVMERIVRGDFLVRNLVGADQRSGALAVGERVRVGQTVQFIGGGSKDDASSLDASAVDEASGPEPPKPDFLMHQLGPDVPDPQLVGDRRHVGVALEGPFRWDLSANISFNRNKVVKLYGGNDVLGAPIDISVINDNINILREGQPIGSFFGYVEKGYDNTGRIVYEDYNGNGIRDIGDKRIIGNPNPNFVYGFNSNMSYKNFELNIFIQGTQGNDIFNLSAVNQTLDYGQALNMPRDVYENHWTPENPTAKYPVISRTSQTQVSNRFVEDGSYLRVKNIQLSYNLPVSMLELHWLRKAQIYVSGQNLLTLTGYSWYDPEVNSYGGVTGANSIQLGIDHYSYPTAKTMTVGLRLGF